MALINNALTTVARVKTKLDITTTTHDSVLEALINGVTVFVESYCGGRTFLETTYTDEVYSGGEGQMLFLRQYPVTALTAFKYRTGTISNPTWNNFDANNYLLDSLLDAIYIYGTLPQGHDNLQVTYKAGYKIDFDNYTDTSLHTLPLDLTEAVENLVIKAFLKRKSQGKTSESFEGANIQWQNAMDAFTKTILSKYRKPIL